jgi:hypothetical protein
MSDYIHAGYGPGGIAAMQSGYGLTQPPTIGSTTRPVNVGSNLYAQPASGMGCVGCMGDNGNGAPANGNGAPAPNWQRYVVPVGIGALGFLAVSFLMK